MGRADSDRDAWGRAEVASAVETPALVIDERAVLEVLERAERIGKKSGCKILYALKPLGCPFLLELMKPWLDGFAASSLFEARLARAVLGNEGGVHITTPGFRAAEIDELGTLCDYLAFNSLGQFSRFAGQDGLAEKAGLRVNPRLPLVDDKRYNPCRKHSKLGVPLGQLEGALAEDPNLQRLAGLQFHTNCDADGFEPLLDTVQKVEKRLRAWLPRMRWFNLGGGYMLGPETEIGPLAEAVGLLNQHGLEVFFEPGAAFVREAGKLVAEVIDLFSSSGRSVAVLDTTINHMPEVFEYQFQPDVAEADDDGPFHYVLAGSTCLAGDVFGRYGFRRPLEVGARVVFENVGAYALVKSHMFNGINLPTIYSITPAEQLVVRRQFTYQDFLLRCGAPSDALV